jgi:Domain of unknown function (DUF4432)
MTPLPPDLAQRTGDRRQFASVRRIILDEGPERGVTALAFSTGGGLDFWLLQDRAMDIGPLWWRGTPLAWQGAGGFRHPSLVNSESDGGLGFGRGFSGFLMTCGLDHTRYAVSGFPQHGRASYLPARITAHGEAWDKPEPVLFAEGEVVQWRHGAEHLVLIRRIEAPIGGAELRIRDRVENRGHAPQRQAMLYHVNIGHPALTAGARAVLNGTPVRPDVREPDAARLPEIACVPAGTGLASTRLGGGNGPGLALTFDTATLPYLQVWHDPRPGAYVLALEPCSSMKPEVGTLADEPMLPPGAARDYALSFTFGTASE